MPSNMIDLFTAPVFPVAPPTKKLQTSAYRWLQNFVYLAVYFTAGCSRVIPLMLPHDSVGYLG